MSRRPSTIQTAGQARAQARLAAKDAPPEPHVKWTTIINLVDRECEKRGLRWYGVPSAREAMQAIRDENPETLKAARVMFLDRLDAFPPQTVLVTPS